MSEFDLRSPNLFGDVVASVADLTVAGRKLGHGDMINAGKLFGEPVMGLLYTASPDLPILREYRYSYVDSNLIVVELGVKSI